jgi:subtilisin-like proprotein convertase family protein
MRTLVRSMILLAISTAVFAASPDLVKQTAGTPAAKDHSAVLTPSILPCDLPAVGSRGRNTLDEVIISEGFENTREGRLPCGWTRFSGDEGTNNEAFGGDPTEWRTVSRTGMAAHSGTHACINAYNADGSANDDWLILPPLPPLTGSISLSYWIATQQATYPEDYEVRVSTTGTQPADFTGLIYTGTGIPAAFTQHTHDLSTYAGAPFYVAIHHTSTDQFVIKLDDVLLTGTFSVSAPPCAIHGIVTQNQTHAAVLDAKVSIQGQPYVAYTDALGAYYLPLVPPATYTVTIQGDYFTPATFNNVVVTAGDTTELNTELEVPAITEHIYVSSEGNVDIADLDSAFKHIVITDNLPIADIDVIVNITHSWIADLTVWLVSPSGHRIVLESKLGGSSANMTNCRFDDEAANPIGLATAPFTGSFSPFDAMSVVDGDSTAGTWILEAYDGGEQDVGYIGNVTLNIKTYNSVAVDEPHASLLPASLVFNGNYPNPFNSRTDFRFELAQPGLVTLALYNTLGQEVAQVMSGRMEAGTHTVNYDANSLASGVYIARLTVNGGAALSRKVVLLK